MSLNYFELDANDAKKLGDHDLWSYQYSLYGKIQTCTIIKDN
jgi:hypothetical protein